MEIKIQQLIKLGHYILYIHQLFLVIISGMCKWGDVYFGDELGSLYIIFSIFIFTILSLIILLIRKRVFALLLLFIVLIYIVIDISIVKSVVHW